MNETLEKVNKIREDYKKIFTEQAYPEKIFEQLAYHWSLEKKSAQMLIRVVRNDILEEMIKNREKLGLVQATYSMIWSYYLETGFMTLEDIKIEEKLLYERINTEIKSEIKEVEEKNDSPDSELDDLPF
jgi:hypothetical protein